MRAYVYVYTLVYPIEGTICFSLSPIQCCMGRYYVHLKYMFRWIAMNNIIILVTGLGNGYNPRGEWRGLGDAVALPEMVQATVQGAVLADSSLEEDRGDGSVRDYWPPSNVDKGGLHALTAAGLEARWDSLTYKTGRSIWLKDPSTGYNWLLSVHYMVDAEGGVVAKFIYVGGLFYTRTEKGEVDICGYCGHDNGAPGAGGREGYDCGRCGGN